jgi:hypothetical protein
MEFITVWLFLLNSTEFRTERETPKTGLLISTLTNSFKQQNPEVMRNLCLLGFSFLPGFCPAV